MKLNSKLMLKLLKEEYDKRLEYYLKEVETRADHNQEDAELVNNARGLKLKDRAGFLYTLYEIIKDESGKIFALLIPPGKGDEEVTGSASTPLHDDLPAGEPEMYGDSFSDEPEYIYSGVNESEDQVQEKPAQKKPESDSKRSTKDPGIRKPNDDAASKKDFTPKIDAQVKKHEEINGMIKVSLEELEKEYSL